MKKLSLCLMLCFLFLGNLAAQWSVGGKVGANFTGLADSPTVEDYKWRTRFNIGGVAAYQLNDWLALQGELLYAQYGFLDKGGFGDNETGLSLSEVKVISHYIDVPILAKVYPFKRWSGFNLEAGVQPGFFLVESMHAKEGSGRYAYMGDRNPLTCSLVFGLAFELPDEKWKNWYCDFRYLLGMTEIYKDWGKMKNRAFQLSVGYLFQL